MALSCCGLILVLQIYGHNDNDIVIVMTPTTTGSIFKIECHANLFLFCSCFEDIMAIYGATTLNWKTFVCELYSGHFDGGVVADGGVVPDCDAVVATAAANCGLSSDCCGLVLREGVPPSVTDAQQEPGRAGRGAVPGTLPCQYVILISLASVMFMLKRIARQANVNERQRQQTEYFEVLQLVTLPTACHHLRLESTFSRPPPPAGAGTPCQVHDVNHCILQILP